MKRARDVGGGYNDGQKQGLKVVKKGEPGSHEIVSHENEPASDLFPCTSTANAFVAHEDESGLDWVLQHLAGDAGQEGGGLGEVTSVGESSTFKLRQGPATARKRVNEGLGKKIFRVQGGGRSITHKDGTVTAICLTKKLHPMTMESATEDSMVFNQAIGQGAISKARLQTLAASDNDFPVFWEPKHTKKAGGYPIHYVGHWKIDTVTIIGGEKTAVIKLKKDSYDSDYASKTCEARLDD